MVKILSKVALVLGILTAAACATEEPALVEDETAVSQSLDVETGQQAKDSDDQEVNSCQTATCQLGPVGNQFCTQLCGDVARCTPPHTTGCGVMPCCVLQ